MSEDDEPVALRLDVWLWRARFFKTRALAGRHIAARGVRITRNGQVRRVDKPAAGVRSGDILTFALGDRIQAVEVLAFGHRRGPAVEAQALYRLCTDGA